MRPVLDSPRRIRHPILTQERTTQGQYTAQAQGRSQRRQVKNQTTAIAKIHLVALSNPTQSNPGPEIGFCQITAEARRVSSCRHKYISKAIRDRGLCDLSNQRTQQRHRIPSVSRQQSTRVLGLCPSDAKQHDRFQPQLFLLTLEKRRCC